MYMVDCRKTFDPSKTNNQTTTKKPNTNNPRKIAHCHLLKNDKKNIKTYDPKQNKQNDCKETQYKQLKKLHLSMCFKMATKTQRHMTQSKTN